MSAGSVRSRRWGREDMQVLMATQGFSSAAEAVRSLHVSRAGSL